MTGVVSNSGSVSDLFLSERVELMLHQSKELTVTFLLLFDITKNNFEFSFLVSNTERLHDFYW